MMKMNKTSKLVLAATGSALVFALFVGKPAPATAASASATVHVTANVASACTITNSPLAFGTYDPLGANLTADLDAQAPLTYACTGALPATISLGNVGSRAMTNPAGGASLLYEIYTSTARSTVWGTNSVSVTGTGASATVDMFGRIPRAQTGLAAGSFAQDIQATINF